MSCCQSSCRHAVLGCLAPPLQDLLIIDLLLPFAIKLHISDADTTSKETEGHIQTQSSLVVKGKKKG